MGFLFWFVRPKELRQCDLVKYFPPTKLCKEFFSAVPKSPSPLTPQAGVQSGDPHPGHGTRPGVIY